MRASLARRRPAERGYVLITVLWTGLALVLGASAFLAQSRQEALQVRAEVATMRAVELARAGLNVALADLGRVAAGQPITPRDGTPATLRMAEGTVTYRIQDEAGKIDIFHAPPQVLGPALVRIGEAEGIDAFDATNVAQALEAYARTRAGRIRSVREALLESGLGTETAGIAARHLTTLGFTAQVNPVTAPRTVLEAIPGLGPSDVEEILLRRQAGREMPRLGSASAWLAERYGPVYTIEAEARVAGGGEATVIAQVAARGLAFRGGLMQYDILSVELVR